MALWGIIAKYHMGSMIWKEGKYVHKCHSVGHTWGNVMVSALLGKSNVIGPEWGCP